MGRLENFIPKARKLTFTSSGKETRISASGSGELTVRSLIAPFVQQMTGTMSLREICLFLDKKGIRTSISEAMSTVKKMQRLDMLVNGDDFLKAWSASPDQGQRSHKPSPSNLNASYFSHARLLGLVQKTTLFQSCERSTAAKILKHSTLEYFEPNAPIIKQGTQDTFFFIVLSGKVEVSRLGRALAELTPLSVFGESAAVAKTTRNADVSAKEGSWLLRINAAKIMTVDEDSDVQLLGSLRSRLLLNQTLAANTLFRSVPTDVLQLFLSRCQLEKHPRERMILKQGGKSTDFYFILKGSVTIMKDGVPVTSLASGEHFGEISAVFQQRRTATVISETQCLLLSLGTEPLYEVLCNNFRLALEIEQTAIERNTSTENVFTKIADIMPVDVNEETEVSLLLNASDFSEDELAEFTEKNYEINVVDFRETETNSFGDLEDWNLSEDDEAS